MRVFVYWIAIGLESKAAKTILYIDFCPDMMAPSVSMKLKAFLHAIKPLSTILIALGLIILFVSI